jgi:hypothetical protein
MYDEGLSISQSTRKTAIPKSAWLRVLISVYAQAAVKMQSLVFNRASSVPCGLTIIVVKSDRYHLG